MSDFSIRQKAESIHFGRTKEYFQEVLSSYENGNNRSAIVMLWSVAVCDLIYKLEGLSELYNDVPASEILAELESLQQRNSKSSEWETKLLDLVYERTSLLEPADLANLKHLQQQRHLAAHPVLNQNRELHKPDNDTTRAFIRSTLEGLLIKPPLYTNRIFNDLLQDLEANKESLTSKENLKRYLESKYLNRMQRSIELSIFKSLWKCVFLLDNEQCSANRKINLDAIVIIAKRCQSEISTFISGERDFFSNIAHNGRPLSTLVYFLAFNPDIYNKLSEDAKIKIQLCINTDNFSKLFGWFIHSNTEDYYNSLLKLVSDSKKLNITSMILSDISKIHDSQEWDELFCKFLATYYAASGTFDQADTRFSEAIAPNLDKFNQKTLIFLIEKINGNDQTYGRSRAYTDHPRIKEIADKLLPTDFDWKKYSEFYRSATRHDIGTNTDTEEVDDAPF